MDIASSEKVCVGEGRDRMTLNHTNFTFTHKVPTMSVGILHICNLWILLKKIVIYLIGRTFHLHRLFCC